MRKLFLLIATFALLVAAGTAVAKTVTVTITKAGYVPNALNVTQGDSVQFTNSDGVAHQVTFKSTTGIVCTPAPLVLQPGASGSCTFAVAGAYSYSDPNAKGNTFRGSVSVAGAPESIKLAATPMVVIYATKSSLSGSHSTQQPGENVDVLAQQCGANAATKLTTVPTGAAGAFSTSASPLMNTVYSAKIKSTTSNALNISVRPRLTLRLVAAHRFAVRVTAAQTFAGKYASFQRYNGTLHRWVALKSVQLKANTTGVAPTVATSASFRSSIKSGQRVRMTLAKAQVGSCYATGLSNTIGS
jgi:plastocyanin